MTPGKPIPIILDELINAVEDHCGFSYYYLDRETGEVLFQSERHYQSHAGDAPDLDNPYPGPGASERFIPVEPMESRHGHALMKMFIASLDNSDLKYRLTVAISNENPFRSFKDVIYDYPDVRKKWHDRHSGEVKKIIEEWLKYNDIIYEFISLGNQSRT